MITRAAICIGALFMVAASPIASQNVRPLPTNQVYRGPVKLPDFAGRDRAFANYRTRIVKEMASGPNFAGHYAIVEIGCGTSCRFAIVADVATGKLYDFPYGGEEYYQLWLTYTVKDSTVRAQWMSGERCMKDSLQWTGTRFLSQNRRAVGGEQACDL